MLRTDDAGRRTPDAGRWTLDAGPSTPYYKLTGELTMCRTVTPAEFILKTICTTVTKQFGSPVIFVSYHRDKVFERS